MSLQDAILQFEPSWVTSIKFDENRYVPGWRVRDNTGWVWAFENRDCCFAKKQDCKAACYALNEAQLTLPMIEAMTDEEFGALVVKYLNW